MSDKTDVWQGTLALMALKTLEALGPRRPRRGAGHGHPGEIF